MATTRDKLIFTHAMARHTSATVRQCEALMRFATGIKREHYSTCNGCLDCYCPQIRARLNDKVRHLCREIWKLGYDPKPFTWRENCIPEFSSARGLTIRVPGGEGIVVP